MQHHARAFSDCKRQHELSAAHWQQDHAMSRHICVRAFCLLSCLCLFRAQKTKNKKQKQMSSSSSVELIPKSRFHPLVSVPRVATTRHSVVALSGGKAMSTRTKSPSPKSTSKGKSTSKSKTKQTSPVKSKLLKCQSPAKTPLSLYYIIDHHTGEALMTDRGTPRTFLASKPTGAATKAFRVFIRSDTGKRALELFYASHARGAAETPVPAPIEALLSAGVAKGTLTLAEAAKYRSTYPSLQSPLFSFNVNICVGRAAAPGATARHYNVRYVPILKPNVHEIRKNINKVAYAALLRSTITESMASASATMGMIEKEEILGKRPRKPTSDW